MVATNCTEYFFGHAARENQSSTPSRSKVNQVYGINDSPMW